MEPVYYSVWQSPIGPLTLAASERGLLRLEFGAGPRRNSGPWVCSEERLAPCRVELEQYFAGKLRAFTVPLDLRGTGFQIVLLA